MTGIKTNSILLNGQLLTTTGNNLYLNGLPISISGAPQYYLASNPSGYITGGNSVISSNSSVVYSTFSPFDNNPPSNAYATLNTIYDLLVLEFDHTSASPLSSSGVFTSTMPGTATLSSGVNVDLYFSGYSTSGAVQWNFEFGRGLNLNYGPITGTTGNVASYNGSMPIATMNIPSGNLNGITTGDFFRFRVSRDPNNVNDTMTGKAQLYKVRLRNTF